MTPSIMKSIRERVFIKNGVVFLPEEREAKIGDLILVLKHIDAKAKGFHQVIEIEERDFETPLMRYEVVSPKGHPMRFGRSVDPYISGGEMQKEPTYFVMVPVKKTKFVR